MEDNKELEGYDYLKIRETSEVTEQLKSSETIYYSEMVTKFNRMDWKQDRIFLVTNLAIYNVK